MTADGRCNRIIGLNSVNGIIKLLGLPEFWGSSLPYVSNDFIPEYRGWGTGGCTGTYITNSTSINSTGSTGNWGRTINSSTTDSLRIPIWTLTLTSRNRDEFLHCRKLLRLWSLYNPSTDGQHWLIVHANMLFCWRTQQRDFLMSYPDHPATQYILASFSGRIFPKLDLYVTCVCSF